MIRFSVITIVRNDPVGVIRTLQSTFDQTYPNYELIVQDGASTDGTSDILRGFGDWIDLLTIEKDDGIYDAMNRALRRASGDYCIFMNANDFFFNKNVLEDVSGMIDIERDDIWTGQVVADETGEIHKFRPENKYWSGSTFDHQAAFIRTSLMQKLEYDTRFPISADLHFFTRARKNGAQFVYEKFPVARKPFAVGASSAFIDRLNDRLPILEAAWSDQYPVRDLVRNELIQNLCATFDISKDYVADKSLSELLVMHKKWSKKLAI